MQYLRIPAATKRRGLRKVENKRLKIDSGTAVVHDPSINHRLILATGRVPQKKGVTGHYRSGQFAGRMRQGKWNFRFLVWWPIRWRSAGPPARVEGQPKQSFLGVSPTAFTPLIYGLPSPWITIRGRKARQRLIDSG